MKRLALLALLLGAPPLVAQLSLGVPRLDADAIEYYAHVRSLYFDHDLDFANEFAHFGILTRGDKEHPTETGHRRTIFSVGPALLWMPFYAAGDLVARLASSVEDGYSPFHIRAVCLASLFYGVVGLLLLDRVLRTLVPPSIALLTLLLLLYATFLYWYLVEEPAFSHAVSFFASAVVLAVFWDGREHLSALRAALLGLLIGLAACVRWQNGVLLFLPAGVLAAETLSRARPAILKGVLVLGAFGLGCLPQMLAWKAIFGHYLLKDPPHGADFLRLGHPFVLQTLFSSRHGLLFWTPVLWGGFLGYVLLFSRSIRLALLLLPPLVFMSYVNCCSGDWWAGGSFSNRRFDSVLPLLAVGLALSLERVSLLLERHPLPSLFAAAVLLVASNQLFMEQYRRVRIPQDDTVSFPQVQAQQAELVASAVGSPPAWPANWIFAAEERLPPAEYDLMVGKYLFYRQNALSGPARRRAVVAMGDPRVDPALLDQGWSSPRKCEEKTCRSVLAERARIFAPLDVPEDLDLEVELRGAGEALLQVNGQSLARLPLAEGLETFKTPVPAAYWHRELNEVSLSIEGSSRCEASEFAFLRRGGR